MLTYSYTFFSRRKVVVLFYCVQITSKLPKIDIKLEVDKHPTEIIGAAASVPSLRFDPQLVAALCDQTVGVVDRVEGH